MWYSRSAELAQGDFVLYQLSPASIRGRTDAGHAAVYMFRDQWINRLVALSGQTVSWHQGQLLVDGKPSHWQEGLDMGADAEKPFVVPDDHVLLATGDLVPRGVRVDLAMWRTLCLVPRTSVRGRIYFRSYPFSRMSPI